MSTIEFTGLIPNASSCFANQTGELSTFTSRIVLTVKCRQKSGSSIVIDTCSATSPISTTLGTGIEKDKPRRAARSRATPATDIASGRLGLTSKSNNTSCFRSKASDTLLPNSAVPGKIKISGSVLLIGNSNSSAEHNIPSDHSPLSLRCLILRPPATTAPSVASGTKSPTCMLNAPQQT